ncbi:autotransporter outer membrane beta-barrel domain-containing protein [Fusobacterium sp.]|uniref:autotransporter outer membrane beta-barrel domain-containing protein n=1 Tax=Fusobacterium sp. TaxID=68766 RepID=UPI002E7643D7|nr:autotransporter outer membrane beta-barrel domain-containing protein [Fusobacterium sp.]MEE1475072.1 autotransporter outer membrane beta-barrel domain-containing protein [Fusobacterium sp.]
MERKNLKEKALFLLCLGALAGNMSTEIYAQGNDPYDEHYTFGENVQIKNEINISGGNEKEYGIFIDGNGGEISFEENVNINKNNFISSVYMSSSGNYTAETQFNKNLIITNKLGYALYNNSSSSSGVNSTILVAGAMDKTANKIQIIGNLKAESNIPTISGTGDVTASSLIQLNLNGKESFFAGKMETIEEEAKLDNGHKIEATAGIELNLKNGATWYAHNSNGEDIYTIDGNNEKLRTLITSDGGVIDIYHAIPNKNRIELTNEELNSLKIGLDKVSKLDKLTEEVFEEIGKKLPEENRKELEDILTNLPPETNEKEVLENLKKYLTNFVEKEIDIREEEIEKGKIGTRTFTLNGVGDKLQNTTFRISSDIENKTADKIVLNGVKVNKDSETYSIQIVADPFESGEWKAGKDDKILVMDINAENSNIDDLNKITVEGKEYTTDIAAGLVKQKITPTIEEDKNNKGDWYLTGIDKVESKGDGHIFAELGAGVNAGMVAAWRADNGDLYQRMGNLRNNEAQQGIWGRIYTGENEVRKGIGLDLEYRAVQVGYDRKNSISDGKLFTGVAFGYFDGNVDYDHGSGESNSATVGAYATYLGRNGAYSDFIVKFGNIDNKLSYSSDNGNYYKADFDTYGLSADAEYGYRYDFNNNYYIEPLAQLSYIYIADEDYTMKLNGQSGAKVSNDDYQSLIGYTGFHYGKKFDDSVVYLRAVLAHEFAGDIDVKARYENTKVNSSISGEDTWVEYGVGFDVKVKEDTAIYGRVQRTTGDVVKNKWHASVGIRYTF